MPGRAVRGGTPVSAGRVQGRVALITGAAQGIGAATVRRFAAEGATVIAADIDDDAGTALAAELRARDLPVHYRHLDIASEAEWIAATAWATATFGGLDILVNNAGIALVKPIADTTLEEFRRVQRINVEGVFLGIKHGAAAMRERARRHPAGGAIVNLSSVLGMRGLPDNIAYGTSKGAVRQMTKCAAIEFAERGDNIRVNSVHPAITATPMVAAELEEWSASATLGTTDVSATRSAFAARLPLKRLGTPEDIAAMVLFVASDECAFTTGAEFAADGGRLAA
ncbi:MAG: glucose 1-dehydrogenase [Proteobacteria bacterium]|nr:glucose 1-dehydrogenase [Pseudomonadota bacterium]